MALTSEDTPNDVQVARVIMMGRGNLISLEISRRFPEELFEQEPELHQAWTLISTDKHPRRSERASKPDKSQGVKAASPRHQFVIALHSPDGVVETGLLGCHREKMPAKLACSIVQRSFSGPGWKQELKELRRFRAILRTMRQDFSALQTVWRRGGD